MLFSCLLKTNGFGKDILEIVAMHGCFMRFHQIVHLKLAWDHLNKEALGVDYSLNRYQNSVRALERYLE